MASDTQVPLIFKVDGDEAAIASFSRIEGAGKRMGAGVEGATSRITSRFKALAGSAGKVGSKISGFGNRLKDAATSKSSLFGAASGVGLRMMSNDLIAAGDEAEAANQKLTAMLESRGEQGAANKLDKMANSMSRATGIDDDAIVEASARMMNMGTSAEQTAAILPKLSAKARIAGKDMNAAARAFGRAFETGSVNGLAQIGVSLDDVDKKAIKAAFKLSKAAGQAEVFARVKANLDKSGIDVGAGIDKAKAARGYFDVQMGNTKEAMGQGAGAFRARYQGALAPLLGDLAQNNPGVLKGAGAAIEAGSIVAPLFTVMATVGQSMPAFKGLASVTGSVASAAAKGFNAMRGLAFWTTASGNSSWIASGKTKIASYWSGVYGNTALASSGKLRIASATTSGALKSAVVALGALAAVAWSIDDIRKSAEDSKLGEEAYAKKRGWRGEAENKVGKWFGTSKIASLTPMGWLAGNTPMAQAQQYRGNQMEAEERRRMRERRARRAATVIAKPSGVELLPTGKREQRVDLRINSGRGSLRQALSGA